MRRHLNKCRTYARYRRQLTGESGPDISDSLYTCHGWTNTHARPVMTADRLAEKLLRIVVSANQPFIFIKNQEFPDLLEEAVPKCPVPSRQIMPDLLSANANHAISELRQELADNDFKVSLALDVWTTRKNYAFLSTFHALYELVTGTGGFLVGTPIPVTCNGNSRSVISPLNSRDITDMSILAITAH